MEEIKLRSKLDHVSIAVKSIDDALLFYRDMLGFNLESTSFNELEKLKIAFLSNERSDVELMEPTEEETVVGRFIQKRGEGIHHICIAVEDIEKAMKELSEKGVRLVEEKPRVSSSGLKVAFIHPKSAHGVLIEIYEKP
jgi:methylmalonyl-CoA/ethylmalonyl-CoA epimerase